MLVVVGDPGVSTRSDAITVDLVATNRRDRHRALLQSLATVLNPVECVEVALVGVGKVWRYFWVVWIWEWPMLSMTDLRSAPPASNQEAFVALFNIGAIAAPVLAYQGFTSLEPGDGELDVALPEGSGCTITERSESFPEGVLRTRRGRPDGGFGHSFGDGYIVVLYPHDVTAADLDLLRGVVETGDPAGVLAGARDDTTGQVKAVTIGRDLTCEAVQVGALRQFSRTWMESIGATC